MLTTVLCDINTHPTAPYPTLLTKEKVKQQQQKKVNFYGVI